MGIAASVGCRPSHEAIARVGQASRDAQGDRDDLGRPEPFLEEEPAEDRGKGPGAVDQDRRDRRPVERHRESPQRVEEGEHEPVREHVGNEGDDETAAA